MRWQGLWRLVARTLERDVQAGQTPVTDSGLNLAIRAVQGDRLGAAEERQGPARRSWPGCSGRTCCPGRSSPARGCASCGRCCGTGPAWSVSVPSGATGSTRSPPTTAVTGPPATESGPGRGWLAGLDLPATSREIVTGGLAPLTGRPGGELHRHARADPRVKVLRTLPGAGEFTALVMVAEIGDISRFPRAASSPPGPG